MFLASAQSVSILFISLMIFVLLALIILVCVITAKKFKLIVCLFATLFTIVGGGVGVIFLLDEIGNTNSSLITKEKPTITAREALPNYIEFTVYANDNYSKVVIELNITDENRDILKTTTLTGTNYVKYHEYTLKYSLSMSEIWNAKYYSYRLLSYN